MEAFMAITEDKVHQIEDSEVSHLAQVSIDDAYAYMDEQLRARKSPLDLYDLWEAQNWKVADLDFSEDSQHWEILMPEIKEELYNTFIAFFIGEQAVTDTLSPLVMGAPDEPNRIFLSTQIVDEARHTVFFRKFFADVLGVSGGLTEALNQLRPGTVDGFKKIFDHQLIEAMDEVRLNPTDRAAWVRGITIYHLVIEGMLALTGQKFLLRVFRDLGMMPGFRAGFTAVTRDESRHVNYGVGAIREQIDADPKMAGEVESAVMGILEAAVKTVEPADHAYAQGTHPNEFPPAVRIDPREVYGFSLTALTKRLKVAGLSREVCAQIEKQGQEYYDQQIALFEEKFGQEHSIRFWERGEVLVP
jgi:ribonucleoside-diphosphate reductase beta chain